MADVPSGIFDPARLAAVRATGLLDTAAEENFDRLAGLAALLLDAPYGFITVVDETRSFWKSCIGIESDDLADRQNPVEESFCQYVIASGQPLIIGDVTADPRTAENPSIASMGVAAWAGFPLLGPQGEVLGTLCVIDTVTREWTPRHVEVLSTLSAAASSEIALRSTAAAAAQLSRLAESGRQRLAFLADVSDALAVADDTESVVGQLAQRIVSLLCDWCLITIVDEDSGQRHDIGRAHRDPERLGDVNRYADLHLVSDSAPSAAAIATGRPVIVPDLTQSVVERSLLEPLAQDALAALKPGSVAVFPLQGKGAPFGAISLVNDIDRGPLTEGELGIAQELSRRAGLSLQNARLHSHQRRIADVLQNSLLNDPPQVVGLQIAVRYRPATENAQVGGDWYDIFAQPGGSTALVIGDVVGHDLHAVTVMAKLSTMMRTIGYDRDATPASVLRRTDQAMTGLGLSTLCTAQVVTVHAGEPGHDGVDMTWSSAGHPAPMILHPDGRVSDLTETPELLLGVRADSPRTDHHATLPAGATLLLMTDGLFERRDISYDQSIADLQAVLSPLAGRPLEQLCEELLAAALPAHPEDDVAIVAVRTT